MSPRPVPSPPEPEDRGRRIFTFAEAKARFTAITKLSSRDSSAVECFAKILEVDLQPWQRDILRCTWPPLDTIGHALQRAAAENA